jgi:hypothetical protein
MPKVATTRATAPLQLVHSDLCGPLSVPTPHGDRYFITFIDDYSRFVILKLLRGIH